MKHPLFVFIAQTYFCCSVAQSCPTLCDPMDSSTRGFPVLHHLPEFAQAHVPWVRDTIQPSHLCCPLLLLPSNFPIIRLCSNESASLIAQLVKNLPSMQKTQVRFLVWEDSPGEGNGNPLQHSCLGNLMDRGAWQATVHGVAKESDTTDINNNNNYTTHEN